MFRRILRGLTLACSLVFAVCALTGCKKKEATVEAKAPEATNPAEVTVTPQLAERIRIGKPEPRDVAGSLEVAARVETDGTRLARVGSPVAGRILSLLVLEGQQVRRGAVLAMLHSNDLSDTQFSFVKAYSQRVLAEHSENRAEQLVSADVIGRAELERRQAELLQVTAELASLRTQLRGLGMSESEINDLETNRKLNADYPIVSSISGTVLERKITSGQVVQPAEEAFLVADLSNVWMVADVPEESAGDVRKGMQVEVKLPALPNHVVRGQLSYVAPIVDPATRTVQVRMNLANRNGLYKPAMLARMTFLGQTERKVTIPQTAVVREENKDNVFVQIGPNKFRMREVALGEETGDSRVLESGISAGETIVLDGAFHLNNQRKQNAMKGSAE